MGPHVGCTGSAYRFVTPEEEEQPAQPVSRTKQIVVEIILQALCAGTVLALFGSVFGMFSKS